MGKHKRKKIELLEAISKDVSEILAELKGEEKPTTKAAPPAGGPGNKKPPD